MRLTYLPVTAAVVSLSLASAPAQTDKMREQMAQDTAALLKDTNHVNAICGSHFTAEFDWKGISEADFNYYRRPAAKCATVLEGGIASVCRDALGKEAVQNQIRVLTCRFGRKRTLTLNDGRLDYQIDFYSERDNSQSDWDFVRVTLEKAL